MDSTLPAPALTGLDAVTQVLGAAVYVAIAVAAWLHAPRDIRTRVFLALALATVVAFTPEAVAYARGIRQAGTLPKSYTAITLTGLSVGALLLFHLTQVFPRRRPWVRASGVQMTIGYVLMPLVVPALVWFLPKSPSDMSQTYILAFIVFGFPLLVLLGLVLPVAAIVSLARSYRDCEAPELRRARAPISWILISQVAGSGLAIVFAPVIALAAPNSLTQTAFTLIIWGFGLLTPVAFAMAVWKLDVLSIDPAA